MDLSLLPSVREGPSSTHTSMKRHHSAMMDEMYTFSGKSDHASLASDSTHFPDALHRSASNNRFYLLPGCAL